MASNISLKFYILFVIELSTLAVKPSEVTATKKTISSNTSSLDNIETFTTENYFLSTKEPFDLCEINSTCNVTDFFNTTESDLFTPSFLEKTPVIKNVGSKQEFCTCDLQVIFF